jgi:hypothetical protein
MESFSKLDFPRGELYKLSIKNISLLDLFKGIIILNFIIDIY